MRTGSAPQCLRNVSPCGAVAPALDRPNVPLGDSPGRPPAGDQGDPGGPMALVIRGYLGLRTGGANAHRLHGCLPAWRPGRSGRSLRSRAKSSGAPTAPPCGPATGRLAALAPLATARDRSESEHDEHHNQEDHESCSDGLHVTRRQPVRGQQDTKGKKTKGPPVALQLPNRRMQYRRLLTVPPVGHLHRMPDVRRPVVAVDIVRQLSGDPDRPRWSRHRRSVSARRAGGARPYGAPRRSQLRGRCRSFKGCCPGKGIGNSRCSSIRAVRYPLPPSRTSAALRPGSRLPHTPHRPARRTHCFPNRWSAKGSRRSAQ
jgi:hypothetical protein